MKCLHCSKSFTSEKRLRQHERAKTCQTECPHCGKNLASLQRLETHLKSQKCRVPEAVDTGRPNKKYDFDDLECFDCGDLMIRCPCSHVDRLNKKKRAIDERFGREGAYFDDIEGVPWENRPHWQSVHQGFCRSIRDSDEHIYRCLYPLKDRMPRKDHNESEEIYFIDNSCYACKRRFSTKQRLDYHMSHNVCGRIIDYKNHQYYDADAQKHEDEFAAAHKERINDMGNWMKNTYGW